MSINRFINWGGGEGGVNVLGAYVLESPLNYCCIKNLNHIPTFIEHLII